MSYSAPAPTETRRTPRILVAGLLVVVAAAAVALGHQSPAPSSPTVATLPEVALGEPRGVLAPPREPPPGEPRGALAPSGERRGVLPPAVAQRRASAGSDGAVPAGTTVFEDEIPGVANLAPSLLRALRRAAADAADDGVEFLVNSGWRSPEYQERLLDEAVSKYGSEREAARWVATPDASAHVSGDAVDVGFAATAWLSRHGARYGLCQVYRNELWHFELRPAAVDQGCPPPYADPTHDPRMQP